MFTAKSLTKSLIPVLALGALALGATAHAQVTFTFTTTNTSSGTAQSSGTNTLAGQTGSTGSLFFTNRPDSNSTPLRGVPFDNIVPFTVIANSNVSATSATALDTHIDDTFNLAINLTSNGQTGVFNFTNLRLVGDLIFTPSMTPGGTGAFTDTAQFSGTPQGPITINVGGSNFAIALTTVVNPGNPGGANPIGSIGGTVVNTSVPEPGSVAMLVGMGVTGAGFLTRRRRK